MKRLLMLMHTRNRWWPYFQIFKFSHFQIGVLLCLCCWLCSCAHKITESGKASFYADKFEGRRTSSGEVFKQNKLTAAHRTLPFGTKVTVVNQANGRSVKVVINDRGPFVAGRLIDLSKKAARKIGMVGAGVASVQIKYKRKKRN